MFAVPGWSISNAELKLQTEYKAKTEHPPPQPQDSTEPNAESKKRKRKQGKDLNDQKVTKGNVDEMWRRVIEGEAPSSGKKSGAQIKGMKKRRKLEKAAENGAVQGLKDTGAEGTKSKDASISPPATPADSIGSFKKSKKHRKRKGENNAEQTNVAATNTPGAVDSVPPAPPPSTSLTPLQQSMRQKLLSARFRHLNQTLYTTPSSQAMELFTSNPELFLEYHAGFTRQVQESWPSNPVDGYISAVKTRGALRPPNQRGGQNRKPDKNERRAAALGPLPRRPNGLCTIADMGCGDAKLARVLTPSAKALKLKLLSFDLHVADPLIMKADISALPIADGTVDVAIFCLSLMGTNWVSFIEEAWRVLRGDGKGECWVSEVKSRFGKVARRNKIGQRGGGAGAGKKERKKKSGKGKDNEDEEAIDDEEIFLEDQVNTAADETDISAFVEVLRTRGFVLKQESVDKSNKMFVKMEFVKHGHPTKGKWAVNVNDTRFGKKKFIENDDGNGMAPEEESKVLKPCVYKTR
ncbi:rRNA processing protein Rrp8 [Blastomyces gilchristii SLH14081]|uniref:Ribosomal RNA-processing protein 8 n=1 Tax=Blastomyces gilchristii (strain SLH14081) TaxID=559298 RepID=A0A179U9J9_BLAGS|nr:rRNA processing protein RRP8 [Blastomyces gilchristii SLH14081]OAT03979.1 rRNA processing protein Rrp8 [Blastomyces gilchristii SLH14081]